MDWKYVLGIGGVMLAIVLLKRAAFVSLAAARRHLAAGALVIDVRSPEEFRAGHVPNAINLPLGELSTRIVAVAGDRQQVLLVHCLSGGRSAVAQAQLRRLGYRNVFNLGGLSRAKQAVANG